MGGRSDRLATVGIFVDDSDFARLFARSSRIDAKIRTALRRNIRIAGKNVVVLMQAEVRSGTYTTDRGLRDRIAQGITLSILTSGKQVGVKISATPKAMQANERTMVAAWQSKKGFRHPVFGNSEVWVAQQGRPFFYKTVAKHRDGITKVVRAAMVEAADSLKKG